MLPAVLAEVLLSRNRLADAQAVLRPARARFSRDLRLRQLEALYRSRRGRQEHDVRQLHLARQDLEVLPRTGSPADEETLGILAGVYKQLAELDAAGRPGWLQRCTETYRRGWERSQQGNNYLGINAAATALWLGQPEEAARLAEQVRGSLQELREQLAQRAGGPRELSYWDQVTLAEAHLLLRDLDRAGELYRDAFARFSRNVAEIAVSKGQARRILEALGLAQRAAEVLGE